MYTLSSKSTDELRILLDEYGIKHGPVVDSTRSLYEKKIREAMAKKKRVYPKRSDKTYYREEEEEVTYVYSPPARSHLPEDYSRLYTSARPEWTEREVQHDRLYTSARPEWTEREVQHERYTYDTASSPYTSARLRVTEGTPKKSHEDIPKEPQSSRFIPVWVQLLFFLVAAVFLYLVFANMETNDYTRKIE
ncbi:LEM_emerin domain-containing protein isoform X2 [Syngnathus scovelli]|uniref:LEM_emerin domain-containing protein isoform X2 n=1 Tax=Syngnathus scovelli TaxID=161590 RepID=UPI00210F59C1|nr:emerin isoform X2 [Syngnathus scovelli]